VIKRLTLAVSLFASASVATARAPCPRQALPPAIESAGPRDDNRFMHSIAFAATPSLELPGRAWVVRLNRKPRLGSGSVEVFRLRRQFSCNRYDIEQRWQAQVTAAQYRTIAEAVLPLTIPPPDAFLDPNTRAGLQAVALDGTGLELEVRGEGWIVRRMVHASSRDGAVASALIHNLVANIVPANQLPTEEWRTPRRLRAQPGSLTGPGTAR